MTKNKNFRRVVYVLVGLVVVASTLLFSLWFHYANKFNLVREYIYDGHKDVYILGTIGERHFDRFNNYSFEDVCTAIENIEPDLVLLTARDDHYRLHSVVDGDIAMSVAYAKCLQENIPVRMINWWMIDDSYPNNATNHLQEDNIFIKISRILKSIYPSTKVLIVTESPHFYEQSNRFEVAGMKKKKIKNRHDVFKSSRPKEEPFKYPPLTSKTWRDRVYFYAYTLPSRLKSEQDIKGLVKDKYLDADHEKFYQDNIKFCKYFLNNVLYR